MKNQCDHTETLRQPEENRKMKESNLTKQFKPGVDQTNPSPNSRASELGLSRRQAPPDPLHARLAGVEDELQFESCRPPAPQQDCRCWCPFAKGTRVSWGGQRGRSGYSSLRRAMPVDKRCAELWRRNMARCLTGTKRKHDDGPCSPPSSSCSYGTWAAACAPSGDCPAPERT
jgi:hypothetical protein